MSIRHEAKPAYSSQECRQHLDHLLSVYASENDELISKYRMGGELWDRHITFGEKLRQARGALSANNFVPLRQLFSVYPVVNLHKRVVLNKGVVHDVQALHPALGALFGQRLLSAIGKIEQDREELEKSGELHRDNRACSVIGEKKKALAKHLESLKK